MAQEQSVQKKQVAPVTEVQSARLPQEFISTQPRILPDPPSMRYKELQERAPVRVVLPRLDTRPYEEEDEREWKKGERKIRGGVVRPVQISPEKDGEWIEVEQGTRVWRVEIQSPGAVGLRLRISNLRLPEGGRLFIYDPDHLEQIEVLHENHAEWYSTPVQEDVARVELIVPSETAGAVQISSVGHLYRMIASPEASITDPGSCNLDVACYPDKMHAGASVARINYILGNYIYYCSGAMLNNNSNDFSPILLTAHHCGVDSTTVHSLNVQFFYRDNVCNTNSPIPGYSASGSRVLGDSPLSDATLVEMAGGIPRQATWAGWSISAPDAGSPVFSVHHPETSYQRISFGSAVAGGTALPVPQGTVSADFHGVQWSSGTVEPGSSGGPLFNQNEQVIGQLWGGLASCSNPTGLTSYGKLSSSFPAFVNSNGENYLGVGLGDDALFPNQTRETATPIPAPGTIDNLVVRIVADDWFKITVPANQQLGYTVGTQDGSLAFGELYRGSETAPVTSSPSGVETKFLNDSDSSQDYYIRVTMSTSPFGTRARYSLTTHFYTATPPTFSNIYVYAFSYTQVRAQVYYSAGGWPVHFSVQYTKDPGFGSFQQTEIRDSRDGFMVNGGPIYDFTNLDPGATYYFRPVITNIAGTLIGVAQAFTVPAFLAPQIYGPTDGSIGVPAQFALNWAPDYSGVPYDVYFGTVPDPPFVTNTFSNQYLPFAWNQHAPYSSKYYWRVAHTYRNVTMSSPVQSFTTEIGPQIGVSANPLNFGAWIFSNAAATLTVTNTGSTWYMPSLTVSGDFGIQSNCGVGIAGGLNPGNSCQVTVTKNHVAIGTFTGVLSIAAHSIFSPDPIATSTVPVQLQVTDLVLSVLRPSRPHRGTENAIAPGQTAAYRVTLNPSGPVSGTAFLGCTGAPAGVSCQIQPSILNLNGSPADVNVMVSVPDDGAQRGRALRLRNAAKDSKTFSLKVAATIGNATRSVDIPVTVTGR